MKKFLSNGQTVDIERFDTYIYKKEMDSETEFRGHKVAFRVREDTGRWVVEKVDFDPIRWKRRTVATFETEQEAEQYIAENLNQCNLLKKQNEPI